MAVVPLFLTLTTWTLDQDAFLGFRGKALASTGLPQESPIIHPLNLEMRYVERAAGWEALFVDLLASVKPQTRLPLISHLPIWIVCVGVLFCGTAASDTIGSESELTLIEHPVCESGSDPGLVFTSPVIKVVSINLAHGRGDGSNQMLQNAETAQRNIAHSARLLAQWDADVVALQEADAASWWSGNFDHVDAVASASGYGCRHHGTHAETRLFNFGTALLSKTQFTRAATVSFPPTPPSTRKGFVAAQVKWNPDGRLPVPVDLTLVSVHLDFSRKSSRERQFKEMTEVLADFPRPLIIMGDLNTEWDSEDRLLQGFVSTMQLVPFEPESSQLGTYKNGEKRLDWVLISDDLTFSSYEVLSETVSDHQPVMASVHLVNHPGQTAPDPENASSVAN